MPEPPTDVTLEITLEHMKAPLVPVSLPPGFRLDDGKRDDATALERLERRRHVARGGMGDVHAAHDPLLGRDVALKVMLRGMKNAMRRRFVTEAQVTAQLDHPNIVPVYDADLAGEDLAYSMKLVTGATLTEILDASGKARQRREDLPEALSLDALLDYFARMCDALAYAYEKGVIHRDLKPDNVMVGAHGEVYIMDWGLARVSGDADLEAEPSHETLPGYAIGTPHYMAPEQARGEEVGPACDQYALGLILYEMVCGRPARSRSGDLADALERATKGSLRPMSAPPGERIRRELAAIVRKATRLHARDRYDSVGALADDVRRFRANQPVLAEPDGLRQRMARWVATHREATLSLVFTLLLLLVLSVGAFAGVAVAGAGLYTSWAEARQERVTRLVTQVGSQAADLEQALARIGAHVEAVSAASQVLFDHGEPQETGQVLTPSAFEGEAKPADTAWSSSYGRPISTWWPDVVISPGVDRPTAVDQARRVLPVRHAMRRAHLQTRQAIDGLDAEAAERAWRDRPGPIRWAIVGTPEGLYLEMPGAAWDASGYDGRLRPWYTLARSTEPTWSLPYAESSTGTLLVACSQQIPSADGSIRGVASLSVSFSYLVDRFLSVDHPAVRETYLVDRKARILMRSGQNDPLQRPADLRDTYDTPPFPDPVLAPALVNEAGIVQASDGDLLLHYPLNNGWWFVARVDPDLAASG